MGSHLAEEGVSEALLGAGSGNQGEGLYNQPSGFIDRGGRALWRIARSKALGNSISRREVVDLCTVPSGPGTALQGALSLPSMFSGQLLVKQGKPPGVWAPVGDAMFVGAAIYSSYMSVLLLCVPLGLVSGALGWNATVTFVLNFLALVPLALLLGEITEDLALRFGDVVGGLLNASFGNVVELILSIAALSRGLYTVVATSLVGSVLSNMLLVLGCCFLFGGIRYQEQVFNNLACKASCSLLLMACISLLIPTASKSLYKAEVMSDNVVQDISHGVAIVLAIVYCFFLFFQLKTHAASFAGEESEEESELSLIGALVLLGGITAIVAVCSEYLTGAIEQVSESSGLSQEFLGLIVLPIAGNACEHITAVFVACRNKMDLALGVALGSSIQIAIFVIPVVVLVGWAIGKPMTLVFDPFATTLLTLAVVHVHFVSNDGKSNWLMGVQLVGTYALIALVFFFMHCPASGCV